MALITRIKSWIDKEILTHTDLNAEFSNITNNAATKQYVDDNIGGGGGNVFGPATHSANYVPQWNGSPNSKTLIEGFAITAAGKAFLDDATAAAQRTTLGLGTAATRAAEDNMTDGSNLPDGHAIKTYGDFHWGGGGGGGALTTIKEAGVQVGGADIVTLDFGVGFDLTETPNTEVNVALDLTEYAGNYGSDSHTGKIFLNDNIPTNPCLWKDQDQYIHTQQGATKLEIVESSTTPGQAPIYIQRNINGTTATNFTLTPGCIYAECKTTNSADKHDVGITIMAIAENASTNTTPADNWGYDDAVAVAGRGVKSAAGYGDCCGVWGSMYRSAGPAMPRGNIMAVEAHIYENNSNRKMYGDRPSSTGLAGGVGQSCWSTGLHVYSDSNYKATAGIFIDANHTKAGYLNAILIDKESFDGAGVSGTVGINMGSYDASNHPQYGIKFGKSYAHIYAPTQADSFAILSEKSVFNYIATSGENFIVRKGTPYSYSDLLTVNPAGELLLDTDGSKKVYFSGNNLMFYDVNAGAKTLSELVGGGTLSGLSDVTSAAQTDKYVLFSNGGNYYGHQLRVDDLYASAQNLNITTGIVTSNLFNFHTYDVAIHSDSGSIKVRNLANTLWKDISGKTLYANGDIRVGNQLYFNANELQSLYLSGQELWYRWYSGGDWHYQKVAGP